MNNRETARRAIELYAVTTEADKALERLRSEASDGIHVEIAGVPVLWNALRDHNVSGPIRRALVSHWLDVRSRAVADLSALGFE